MKDVLIIGIAGGTGSGKSTLTERLKSRFGDDITVIRHDDYYKEQHALTYEQRVTVNYDCPEAFENELMIEQLQLLKEGRSVECPIYDFTIHDRKPETVTIEPKPVILVPAPEVLSYQYSS